MKVTLLYWYDINKVYGIDENSKKVNVTIYGFYPFIYMNRENFEKIKDKQKIHKFEYTQKQFFYGFDGEKKHNLVKCYFKNTIDMYIFCKSTPFRVYEKKNQNLKFFHQTKILPCGSYDIKVINGKWQGHYKSLVSCQVDYIPDNLVEMALDIECINPSFKFPEPERENDVITHIGVTINEDEYCFSLNPCNKINDNHFIFDSEYDLLVNFSIFVRKMDPDVIITYNGDTFDMSYIYNRMVMNNIVPQLGRDNVQDELNVSRFSSAQRGIKDFKRVKINGRISYDILQSIEKLYTNLESYKLDNVAKTFLNSQKDDIRPIDIHKSFVRKDIELSTKVALYCMQDTRLTHRLYRHLKLFITNFQMSNVCMLPFQDILQRGETIKTMSLIMNEISDKDYIIQDIDSYKMDYEGATVINPDECGKFQGPIITLDFASLYPSIIMAHNLCYTTIVKDKRYLGLPGYEYQNFEWKYKDSNIKVTFVKNINGVSKNILKNVGLERKKAKKEMRNHEPGTFEYDYYDKKQLSYKLVMNSYYGFLASMSLSCPEIAATVTYLGRTMIQQVKDYIHKNISGAKVLYGDTDSVMIDIFSYMGKIIDDQDSKRRLKQALELGPKLADEITKIFNDPIKLEFEKVYMPYILLTKKRYIGVLYTQPEKYDKIDKKGIVLKRRGNFNYMKTVYSNIVDLLLWNDDPKTEIRNYLINSLSDLNNGLIDIKELVYSVKFKGDGEYKIENISQVLFNNIKSRNGYDLPETGERINFCYINVFGKNNLLSRERVEHYDYVVDNKISLDYKDYISKLKNPIKELLKGVIDVEPIFYEYESKKKKRKNPQYNVNQQKITKFFK